MLNLKKPYLYTEVAYCLLNVLFGDLSLAMCHAQQVHTELCRRRTMSLGHIDPHYVFAYRVFVAAICSLV